MQGYRKMFRAKKGSKLLTAILFDFVSAFRAEFAIGWYRFAAFRACHYLLVWGC
jgi:hypothetical protein